MTMIVQIVARSAPSDAINLVEEAFYEAGLETMLFRLGDNEKDNDGVVAELATNTHAHPCQVWIVPSAFVELVRHHQDRAKVFRSIMDMTSAPPATRRLLITLDPDYGEEPDGHRVLSLDDIAQGSLTSSELRSIFEN